MRVFLTEYHTGDARYGNWLLARGWKHAGQVARRRGLGEKPVGIMGKRKHALDELPSAVLRSKAPFARKAHALCFLGLVALSSGAATARDFFDDEDGLLHQLVHIRMGLQAHSKRQRLSAWIAERAAEIERAVPGWRV